MFVNLKYLIVTIAAIFFALGIGIMIGFNLNNSEILSNQQVKLIEDMDSKLNELRIKNDELQIESASKALINESYESFLDNYSGILLKDMLIGKNIVIIQSTDDYFFPDLNEFYASSGINIEYQAVIKSPEQNQNINSTKYPEIFEENNIINYKKLYSLVTEAFINKNNEKINMYVEDKIIDIIYQNPTEKIISNVVLIGGNQEKNSNSFDNIDNAIISTAKQLNINIIGTEDSKVLYSYIDAFKNSGISTVDNLDQTIGKISLAFILNGSGGNYGSKETAQSLFPKTK